MQSRTVTEHDLSAYSRYLHWEEKSKNTIAKYLRDVRVFLAHLGGAEVTKEAVIAYKNKLLASGYAIRSINSMLASLNSLFAFLAWDDLRVRSIRVQRQVFSSVKQELTRADYLRLLEAAQQKGDARLQLVLQTICATGIRVSELVYITVEAAKRGEVSVSLKGKTRTVLIVRALQKKLLRYAQSHGIASGAIFITRGGKPLNRSNVWREMKNLCLCAGVAPEKVFPHNLRHLFARTFYGAEKDIAKLADVLGHSSIDTTRIYIISTGNEHRRRMENLRLVQ